MRGWPRHARPGVPGHPQAPTRAGRRAPGTVCRAQQGNRPADGPTVRPLTPPIFHVPKSDVAAHLGDLEGDAEERAVDLVRRYDCSDWPRRCRHYELREAFYVLDLLDRVLTAADRSWAAAGRSLDVGARHWPYLAAQRAAVPGAWDGVELEGHRRYRSLQTRESVARWRLRGWDDCRYHSGSVTALAGPYRLVTWFLPFVTITPLVLWGLRSEEFRPTELLAHTWGLLEPGGLLLVTNQDEDEADAQGRLFAELGITAERLGPLPSPLSPFVHVRHGWLARCPA